MMNRQLTHSISLMCILLTLALFAGCGGGGGGSGDDSTKPENITGDAIIDLQLVDGHQNEIPPAAPSGYTLLDIDLNKGTVIPENYIWLYYKMGKADGSDGEPIGSIYTVDEFGGETGRGGVKLDVNLNASDYSADQPNKPLWLYYVKSEWPVARCIVVYNATTGEMKYAPPEAEGKFSIVWVQQLKQGTFTSPYTDEGIPAHAQDLNENQSFPPILSDYIYIGYGKD